MTVQELIDELEKYDPNDTIYFSHGRFDVISAEIRVEEETTVRDYGLLTKALVISGNFTPY